MAAQTLYTPLEFAMVRTPLLPIETYASLANDEDHLALLEDPQVRRAVAVGSLSLLNALDKFAQSSAGGKDADRARAKLQRYLIRMTTRPTPYGLFAACANVPIGDSTDLVVKAPFGASHTRPDMAWLMDVVADAEADPAIRRKLRFVRNPLIVTGADRIALHARAPAGRGGRLDAVSARATPVVRLALDLAARPIDYSTLAARLAASSAAATDEKVDRLLTELWEQSFLLSDLRPPLTIDSPARYVLDRFAEIPEATTLHESLSAVLQGAADWDRTPHEESVAGFRALLKKTGAPDDASKGAPLQVDLELSVEGRLGARVASEAARAAELLLRLSPSPQGLSNLAAYRSAFLTRYGYEREVALLEVLDSDRGLGSPSSHGHGYVGPDAARNARRSAMLLDLACTALHTHQRVVQLDERIMSALATADERPDDAPLSLDINVLVGARSAAAIDEGDFSIVVGPNLGGWAAGRNFGRFAYMSAGAARTDLRSAAAAEQSAHRQDHLWVEVVYLPSNIRSANVAIRPAIRTHEVTFGVSPGVAADHVIPLEELVVGVTDNRFHIRWTRTGQRLHFVSGHMLNPMGAPIAAQFLLQVAHDGVIPFVSFDWGPAEGFPFLPRVQAGRIVLRPAEWTVRKETIDRSFDTWRATWEVPRYVSLSAGDNRLVLALHRRDHVEQVLAEGRKLQNDRSLVLQEVVPALDEAWLTGPGGHYYSEFIVPLVRRAAVVDISRAERPARREIVVPGPVETPAAVAASQTPSLPRLHPPGSEWLYVKLYAPPGRQDEIIGESLGQLAENAVAAGLAESWFFIRYADPDQHLRVRFHGAPDRLTEQLFPQVCQWGRELMDAGLASRYVFDTYEQELERFGGAEGMRASEALFHADSRAATELVKVLASKAWSNADDRTALLALSTDTLLAALGVDDERRAEWYERQAERSGPDTGADYRRLKTGLRAALGSSRTWLAGKPFASVIERALAQREEDVTAASGRLRAVAAAGALNQPPSALWSSYTHLHLNRLGAAASESSLLGLLHRTRAGLAKAPAAPRDAGSPIRQGDEYAKTMVDGGPDADGGARRRDRE